MSGQTDRMDQRQPGHTVTGAPGCVAAHAARPPVRAGRVVLGVVGVATALAALGLAAAACLGTLDPASSTPTSAQSITVTPSAGRTVDSPIPSP